MTYPQRIQEINSYIVLKKEEKILVLKRKNGLWEFPGGNIEWGELPEKAAARECKEETGITPKEISFLGITSATYKKEENEKHSIYLVYSGKCIEDVVTLSEEHTEYRWLTLEELKYLKLGLNAESAIQFLKSSDK